MAKLARLVALVASCSLLGCAGAPPEREAQAPESTPVAAAPRPSVTELDPARVVFAMQDNESELRKCFFRAPSASGFVRIGFQVDKLGAVQEVAVRHSTIGNSDVEDCLRSRVGELRFGELESAAKAEWTYVYRLAEPFSEKEKKTLKKERKRKQKKRDAEPGVVIDPSSSGSIEPDKIEQVVQAKFPLFAHCYRDGIERNNSLKGWLRLRFVIDANGRVENVLDGDSDLPDRRVVDCVAESFYALKFPAPHGSVRVLYRVDLD